MTPDIKPKYWSNLTGITLLSLFPHILRFKLVINRDISETAHYPELKFMPIHIDAKMINCSSCYVTWLDLIEIIEDYLSTLYDSLYNTLNHIFLNINNKDSD